LNWRAREGANCSVTDLNSCRRLRWIAIQKPAETPSAALPAVSLLYFRRRVAHFYRRMIRIGLAFFAAAFLAATSICAAATNDAPDFNEVLGLVRTHLAGATDADLNRVAVDGLLAALRGKVSIVSGESSAVRTNVVTLARSGLLENDVAYLRVVGFEETLAKDIAAALARFGATNKLIGLVLDLRFAGGEDYAAAAAVADLFQAKARPLIEWGSGAATAKEKSDAIKLPVGVLVDRETGGAAEALAAVLRETGAGLILGGVTAGRAMIGQEFPLKNGQRLRVATLPVKVGDGLALTTRGLQPDIEVFVTPDDERAYLEDPYGPGTKLAAGGGGGLSLTNPVSGTNRTARRLRPNEADLVRARRDGLNLDGELPEPRTAAPAKPLLRDPVLARAVDLLKGLAVVRPLRP
jgi:hypothetical protein